MKRKSNAVITFIKKHPITFRLSRVFYPNDFERMLFVIKAYIKNNNNSFKNVLHVEQSRTGSRLVATDGLRLHYAEISRKIKSGNYKPIVTKDFIYFGLPIENIKFPEWSKIIPEETKQKGVINLEETGLKKDRKLNERLSLAFNDFIQNTGEPINLRYLEDLTKRKWSIHCQNGKKKAFYLKEDRAKLGKLNEPFAVIMPIPQVA